MSANSEMLKVDLFIYGQYTPNPKPQLHIKPKRLGVVPLPNILSSWE